MAEGNHRLGHQRFGLAPRYLNQAPSPTPRGSNSTVPIVVISGICGVAIIINIMGGYIMFTRRRGREERSRKHRRGPLGIVQPLDAGTLGSGWILHGVAGNLNAGHLTHSRRSIPNDLCERERERAPACGENERTPSRHKYIHKYIVLNVPPSHGSTDPKECIIHTHTHTHTHTPSTIHH